MFLSLIIYMFFFFLMIRQPPRSTLDRSSAASDVYKRQANEPSKFGFTPTELLLNLKTNNWIHFKNVKICGLMAMASNTEDQSQINAEFHKLKELFETIKNESLLGTEFTQLSIGMSNDCLLYTSDAADERSSVDLGGRRIIKKKKSKIHIADNN